MGTALSPDRGYDRCPPYAEVACEVDCYGNCPKLAVQAVLTFSQGYAALSSALDAVPLSEALATPLVDLRFSWLEARCCGRHRSLMWFHAAKRPRDLLSDFAFEYACPKCGVMPALTLLRSERTGAPAQGWRLHVCEAFED